MVYAKSAYDTDKLTNKPTKKIKLVILLFCRLNARSEEKTEGEDRRYPETHEDSGVFVVRAKYAEP